MFRHYTPPCTPPVSKWINKNFTLDIMILSQSTWSLHSVGGRLGPQRPLEQLQLSGCRGWSFLLIEALQSRLAVGNIKPLSMMGCALRLWFVLASSCWAFLFWSSLKISIVPSASHSAPISSDQALLIYSLLFLLLPAATCRCSAICSQCWTKYSWLNFNIDRAFNGNGHHNNYFIQLASDKKKMTRSIYETCKMHNS